MSEYDKEPLSRAEEILDETSSGTEYDKEPLSRVEFRLKEVMAKIDGLVPDATVYKPAGSVTFANLPTPSKSTLGYVYDVSDTFTTTSDFKEGSGKKYPAGTNVAIVDIGTDENPIYKYDVLSGFIDMDNYVEKEAGKGLSSNDFTNEDKNKLDGLENYDDTDIRNDISDLSDAVEDKVDKVAGKGLSTNDFTDAAKNKLDDLENYDDTEIKNDISGLNNGKVDKVNGKGLSTNDFNNEARNVVDNSLAVVTSTSSPVSTLDDRIKSLTIYGKSEIVDGAIKSAGEGWSVVRLADLNWSYNTTRIAFDCQLPTAIINNISQLICGKYQFGGYISSTNEMSSKPKGIYRQKTNTSIFIKDTDYTTVSDFIASLGDATLCYQLADPSQGNTIAIKTDDGTGINGTMATFTTGTPLYGVSDTVRDVMVLDGSSGEVTKKCASMDLGTIGWTKNTVTIQGVEYVYWSHYFPDIRKPAQASEVPTWILSDKYEPIRSTSIAGNPSKITVQPNGNVLISTEATTDVTLTPSGKFIYELATPTTEPLTTAENESIAGLKTYSPQTTITINDNPEYEVEAYANTANGKAMQELEKKIPTDYVTDAELTDILDGYVEVEDGKGLSTNDYTDADKALVQDSPITVTATTSPISTANGKPRAITIYGKSEIVDGAIKSAGEGYAVVRLADLTWQLYQNRFFATNLRNTIFPYVSPNTIPNILSNKYITMSMNGLAVTDKSISVDNGNDVEIKDLDYTTVSDFIASLGDATLCYQLADPSQGNTIAIKTDDGTGINGTMATFTTGTPLRGIPDTDVRDVMAWDGSAGTVTKNCNKVRLADLMWDRTGITSLFQADVSDMYRVTNRDERNKHFLCSSYSPSTTLAIDSRMDDPSMLTDEAKIFVYDTRYSEVTGFTNSLGDAELVYELATPTTLALTSTENDSIAGLRTFQPQTHAQNNAGATMTVEAYAGTANGQAVNELKQDVQSEISALKITQSDTLTLTVADWSSNQQTVTYAHDTAKRNVIDVEPASIKAWTAAGILATAETASTITFECDTVPTADLSFRITSMEVR